jgi:hypothetical protein
MLNNILAGILIGLLALTSANLTAPQQGTAPNTR